MDIIKILVTGADGQLGKEIQANASYFPNCSFVFTNHRELDICNQTEIKKKIAAYSADILINCAAYTAVDKAESEPERARMINATATSYLAEACKHFDIPLVHVSTDFVFDGKKKTPYIETDTPNPLCVYGQTKLEGEQLALSINPKTIIVRTSWVYSPYGNNFVKTIIRLAKEKPMLKVVSDQTGSPTYAYDLAWALLTISKNCRDFKKWGIYHFSNEGEITWFDFANAILKLKGINTPLQPIGTAEFPTAATRPTFSVLSKEKIKNTFGITILPWKQRLEECLKKIT